MLTKQETLLERVESSRVREPRRTALSCGLQPQFYGDGVSFQVVSGQSSDPQSLHRLTVDPPVSFTAAGNPGVTQGLSPCITWGVCGVDFFPHW